MFAVQSGQVGGVLVVGFLGLLVLGLLYLFFTDREFRQSVMAHHRARMERDKARWSVASSVIGYIVRHRH